MLRRSAPLSSTRAITATARSSRRQAFSASTDGALFLARLIAGEETAKTIQLGIEYYPAPPFSYASPDDVPEPIREVIRVAEESLLLERMNATPPRFAQPAL